MKTFILVALAMALKEVHGAAGWSDYEDWMAEFTDFDTEAACTTKGDTAECASAATTAGASSATCGRIVVD